MADAYNKSIQAPFTPPGVRGPLGLNQQLPENIQWLPDGRGFRKRPGSLPFAQSTALTNAAATVTKNWPLALAAVRMPSPALAASTTDSRYSSSTQLLGMQYCGLVLYSKLRAIGLTGTTLKRFVRSPVSRADSNYYLYNYATAAVGSAIAASSRVSDLTVSTLYTDFNQQNELAWELRPERFDATEVLTGSPAKTHAVHVQKSVPGTSNRAAPVAADAGNTGRLDIVANSGGCFIGGSASCVQHFDGFRSYVDGAFSFSDPTWTITASVFTVGALNGTYQYFFTHVIRLPTGEVIEGEASPVFNSGALVNQQVNVVLPNGSMGTPAALYRFSGYTTTTVGTVSVVDVPGHDFAVGEYVYFFTGATTVLSRRVVSVSGTQLTLDATIALSGTTGISKGDSVRLYRTEQDGAIFFVLQETPAATWAALVAWGDNVLDAALGNEFADTTFTRTPSPSFVYSITEHQKRIVVLAGSSLQPGNVTSNGRYPAYESTTNSNLDTPALYFSSATSQHYYPREYSFTVSMLDNEDHPVGVVSSNDTLYIFNRRSIYYVHGTLSDDPSTYTVTLLTDQLGCTQPRSIINVGGTIFFVSQKGLTTISGTTLAFDVGAPVRSRLLQKGRVQACYFWPSKNLLLVANDRPTLQNSYDVTTQYYYNLDDATGLSGTPARLFLANASYEETLVYDLTAERWAVWTMSCYNGGAEIEGDFVYVPSFDYAGTNNSLRRLCENCNWTDSGVAFTSRFYTPWFDDGAPMLDKTYRRLGLFSTDTDGAGQGFSLTLKTERDWEPGTVVDSVTLSDFNVGVGYGLAPYGTTPYGDPDRPYKVIALSGQKVKSLRAVIENSEPNGDMVINALAIESADSYVNMKDQ